MGEKKGNLQAVRILLLYILTLFLKECQAQEDDGYEIPDRQMDPAKFHPPLDHDLYLQSQIKQKFGKRSVWQSRKGIGRKWERQADWQRMAEIGMSSETVV